MKFSIQISTKNRLADLIRTLESVSALLSDNVECIVCDDGSTDGTFNYIRKHFPKVVVFRHEISKGYISCRNEMLNKTKADYVISLDDDAHFISENPLETIENYFKDNPKCGLIGFRIFWGESLPDTTQTADIPERVKSFVGCGHTWRMKAWCEIPNYPEWFMFYGEENFAALQLFKKNIEVHYVPSVLVHHRVDMQARKTDKIDFMNRSRNSLRADWYFFLLFYPFTTAMRKIMHSVWIQFRTKVFNGSPNFILPMLRATGDVVSNIPKIVRNRNVLARNEYQSFVKLTPAKIFWKP